MPETTWSDTDVATAAKLNQIEDQIIVTCTSSTRPTGTEGRMIFETDTDKLMIYDGAAWNLDGGSKWNTFTPSWTAVTLGTSPTNVGAYRYVAGGIRVLARLTLGTSTGDVTGSVTMTVPNSETAAALSNLFAVGSIQCITGTTETSGSCRIAESGTEIQLYVVNNVSTTNPFDWGPGDQILLDITVPL